MRQIVPFTDAAQRTAHGNALGCNVLADQQHYLRGVPSRTIWKCQVLSELQLEKLVFAQALSRYDLQLLLARFCSEVLLGFVCCSGLSSSTCSGLCLAVPGSWCGVGVTSDRGSRCGLGKFSVGGNISACSECPAGACVMCRRLQKGHNYHLPRGTAARQSGFIPR